MKKRMQSMVMTFIAAVAITLMPFAAQAASPFACRSMSRVGAQSMEGPLTLTCSSCTNAIEIPSGKKISLATGETANLYRYAANTLKTDGLFISQGNFYAANSILVTGTVYNESATNGGSLAFNDPTRWLSTTTALLESSTAATAGTDTAFTLKSLNALDVTDDLFSIQTSAGSANFRVSQSGNMYVGGNAYAGYYYGTGFAPPNASASLLFGRTVDGTTAIANKIGNGNALTTAGAKILSLYSDAFTTEKAFFSYTGALTTPSINFSASRWEDIRVPLITAKPGATKAPGFDKFKDSGSGSTGVYAYHFDAAAIEEVFFSVQLPHGYKEGTALKPHVHWSPTTTGVGNVVFDLECTVAAVNGTFANTTTTTVTDAASTIAYKHQLSSFTDISGGGLGISSMLMCRIARVGDNVADTYAADIAVLEVDFHYEIDTVGSSTATAK